MFPALQQDSVGHGTHFFARRDACARGHEYVEGSYWVHDGARRCKACQYLRKAKHLAKKRAASIGPSGQGIDEMPMAI